MEENNLYEICVKILAKIERIDDNICNMIDDIDSLDTRVIETKDEIAEITSRLDNIFR